MLGVAPLKLDFAGLTARDRSLLFQRRALKGPVACLRNELSIPSKEKVQNAILKQAALLNQKAYAAVKSDVRPDSILPKDRRLLGEAYDRCRKICAEHSKTFYLAILPMKPEKQRALWAINVWCQRTDALVDGPIASLTTPETLEKWEERLEDTFRGCPHDMLDAALSDTVSKYPIDSQPFRDMIEGMKMDIWKSRYENFDELYLYCYRVAGTVGFMSLPVIGIDPESMATMESVCSAAVALGVANQLTNILRDVGEDARRGRVYLPQDELAEAGLSEGDVFAGEVTDKWIIFMKQQITRARIFYKQAEKGVSELSAASRWPVLASLVLYQKILDEIEANDYNNFTKKARVSMFKKLTALSTTFAETYMGL